MTGAELNGTDLSEASELDGAEVPESHDPR